jgi:hypothetical protein
VAVSKGHPTRLFPAPGDAANVDRLLNVLPGTCVDKQVVSCHEFDFLLVSNASVQVGQAEAGGAGAGGAGAAAGCRATGAVPGGATAMRRCGAGRRRRAPYLVAHWAAC